MIVLVGVLSNIVSEIGYVLLVLFGGIIFLGVGRYLIVGLVVVFVGVLGGYSVNLLLGIVDFLLVGLFEEVAQIIDDSYWVNVVVNYYFMVVSMFIVVIVGIWVTECVVVLRFGFYRGNDSEDIFDVL